MSLPLLFVAADRRECEPWVARWDSSQPAPLPVHWARAGRWRGREVLAIANGAGAERAAAAVKSAGAIGSVCNIGFCGALDDSLSIADVFIATEIRNCSRSYIAARPAGPDTASGPLASIPRIAGSAAEKLALRQTGALAVEMEAAGAARAAEELGVPFYCVRAVSDLAREDFANDFNGCLLPDGRFNTGRLVAQAFHRPVRRFGELIRLARRTALASQKLGEFLANCTF